MSDREARVRERAHQLWEQEGRPHGRDADHWDQATREVDAQDSAAPPEKKAPRARKSAPKSAAGAAPAPARKKRASK